MIHIGYSTRFSLQAIRHFFYVPEGDMVSFEEITGEVSVVSEEERENILGQELREIEVDTRTAKELLIEFPAAVRENRANEELASATQHARQNAQALVSLMPRFIFRRPA